MAWTRARDRVAARERVPVDPARRRVVAGLGLGVVALIAAACGGRVPPTTPVGPSPIGGGSPTPPSPSPAASSPAPTATGPGSAAPSPPTPSETASADPSEAWGALDRRARIAQMLLVGFLGLTTREAAGTVRDIRDRGLGGVLLFDYDTPTGRYHRNIHDPNQVRALVTGLRAAATVPLLVAIDEEGGQVDRLKARYGFPATVSEASLGTLGDAATTRKRARAIGRTLASLGIDLDLAPVVDVDVNPRDPVIGALDRSFSADPDVVARQGAAFLEGLHDAAVGGALKHFPGHGSSTTDSHLGVTDVTDTWTDRELIPFRRIIAAHDPDAVLVAHVFDRHLDPTYPASLSAAVIDGMLRRDLGFDGVVITDDLQMGAIRDAFGYPTAVERAILAGADILTIANEQVMEPDVVARTIDIIDRAVDAGRIDEARIDASWRRIARLKARLAAGEG